MPKKKPAARPEPVGKKTERTRRITARANEILKLVVSLSCNVCEKHFGYAEIDGCASALGPAGYCSRECIWKAAVAHVEVEMEG